MPLKSCALALGVAVLSSSVFAQASAPEVARGYTAERKAELVRWQAELTRSNRTSPS